MTASLWLTSAGIVLLLAISFFFSGSETALTAASRARMHQLARGGDRRAAIVEKLTTEKERMIGAILLGNNIVNILASTLAASVLIQVFGEAGIVYATIAMTAAVVVFSEVLPKTLALIRPDAFALVVAPAVRAIVLIFSPVTRAVQALVNMILKWFGLDASRASAFSAHDEIRGTVELLHSEGEVRKADRDMLGGILDLRHLLVRDVMVHRTQMFAIDVNMPPRELVEAVLDSAYSRIPVYGTERDDIIGILHTKDVLRALLAIQGDVDAMDIRRIMVEPWYVLESKSAQAQLSAFLNRRSHMAMVVDEHGGLEGLVTLEDIVEEITGQIADEHDEPDAEEVSGIRREPDGSYVIDASLPIRDVNRAFDWNLPEADATTIAGIVLGAAKAIPPIGYQVTAHGFRFEVIGRERQRLTQVRITPLSAPEAD